MTIPISTAPAVKAALFAALQLRAELANVSIEYAPVSTFPDDDLIVLAGVRGQMAVGRMVGSGGQGWLNEEYVLTVSILVFHGVDEAQVVEQRAHTIDAAVVDTVRIDPSVGGLVIQANPSTFEVDPAWDDEHLGTHSRYDLGIHVEASL